MEDASAEDQFDGHGRPDTGKAISGCQNCCQGEAHKPHTGEIHHGGLEGVASTDADAVTHYGSRKEGFGPCFNAQSLGAKTTDFLYR